MAGHCKTCGKLSYQSYNGYAYCNNHHPQTAVNVMIVAKKHTCKKCYLKYQSKKHTGHKCPFCGVIND